MSSSESVWKRTSSEGTMSKRLFAFLVCFWTLLGLTASGAMASHTLSIHWQPSIWAVLGLGLVLPLVGVFMAMRSGNPLVSLAGYALIALPFGAIAGPVVAQYTAASVVRVMLTVGGMTAVLGLVGALYPKSLEGWGIWLFGALLLVIFGRFGVSIAGMFGASVKGAMTWIDWIAVILFGGYIIFDMNRAMRVERTLDNSIDCAVALYLDVFNLFFSLLGVQGERKS